MTIAGQCSIPQRGVGGGAVEVVLTCTVVVCNMVANAYVQMHM